MKFNKTQLLAELVKILESNLKTLVESSRFAKEAATSEEAKAENKYDTRGLEASYLAGAQSKRTLELQEVVFRLQNLKIKSFTMDDPIASTAIVRLSDNEGLEKLLFILPVAGGIELSNNIQSLAIQAPLAQILLDKYVSDTVELQTQNKIIEYEILEIF